MERPVPPVEDGPVMPDNALEQPGSDTGAIELPDNGREVAAGPIDTRIGSAVVSMFGEKAGVEGMQDLSSSGLMDLAQTPEQRDVESRMRALLSVPLYGRDNVQLLPSTIGYISAHLWGRVPIVLTNDDELQVEFRVADRGTDTELIVEDFAASLVSFLGLDPTTDVSISIETLEEMKSKISEPARRKSGL